MTASATVSIDRPKERLHPLHLVTGLGGVIKGAWGLIAGGAYFAFQDRWWLAALLFGGFFLYSMAGLLVHWLTFEFQVGDDELRIDHGLLSRSSRAIPFDRVTDVDIEQGPVHRLLGLARVRMETGGSSGGKEADAALDPIPLERAEAIREFVRARRSGTTQATPGVDDSPALFALDRRRLLTLGLFNFSLAAIAAALGATQTLGGPLGFDPFQRTFWIGMVSSIEPLRQFVLLHSAIAVIGGAILVGLIGIATGLFRTILRESGFRLDRTESGFRRRRGLFTLTDVTIPARRVQAAILATGPVRRRFGWYELRFQSLASDDKQSDHVVAPLARIDEARAIQRSLGRPLAPDPDRWKGLPRGYVSNLAVLLLPGTIAAFAIAWLFQPVAFVAALGAVIAIATRWLDWRHARYALDGDHLFIERGWWRFRRAIVPLSRVQSVELNENFWTRRFGFRSLTLGVPGGTLLRGFAVPAMTPGDAAALRDRLVDR